MIIKLVLFAFLAASPVLGSSIKGYREEAPQPAPAKGQRPLAPVEQQRITVEQTKRLETITADKKEELREEQHSQQQIQLNHEPQQKLDEIKQEREPLVQQKLEEVAPPPTKHRYEAKSQVPIVRQEPELAKGQRVDAPEQQRVEETPKAPLESQKQIEVERVERVEQVQRDTSSYDSQQVELHEEQQQIRYEAASGVTEQRHQQEEVQQVEELQQQQVQYPVKGRELAAPLGQAEPYAFEYQVEGSSRRESGDVNGVVRGQYTLQGSDGASRIVDYVADANGFRASVNTNEFGTEARSPAGVELRSSQPEAQDISLRLEGKTRESLQAPAPAPAPPANKSPQIPDNWRATKGQVAVVAPLPALVAQPLAIVVAAPAPAAEQPAEAAPRAPSAPTKGQYPLKTHEPVIRAPAKGELGDKLQQQPPLPLPLPLSPPQQQQVELIGQAVGAGQLESIDRRAPSAEYRAAKTLIRSGPVQPARVGFESATAHRLSRAPVVRPVYLAAPPAVPYNARPVVAPVRTHLRQAPAARGHYYQADRHYPSSSISAVPSAGYRRQVIAPSSSSSSTSLAVASGEHQPRSYSVDDDSLTSSFDRSA